MSKELYIRFYISSDKFLAFFVCMYDPNACLLVVLFDAMIQKLLIIGVDVSVSLILFIVLLPGLLEKYMKHVDRLVTSQREVGLIYL